MLRHHLTYLVILIASLLAQTALFMHLAGGFAFPGPHVPTILGAQR